MNVLYLLPYIWLLYSKKITIDSIDRPDDQRKCHPTPDQSYSREINPVTFKKFSVIYADL